MLTLQLGLTLALLLPSPNPDPTRPLRMAHARGLMSLIPQANQNHLYLDAERLAREALEWDAEVQGATHWIETICTERAQQMKPCTSEAYLQFLNSERFETSRSKLMQDKSALIQTSLDSVLSLAKQANKDSQRETLEQAIYLALELGSPDSSFAEWVEPKLLRSVRDTFEKERNLSRLVLGERIAGPPLESESLSGRIVIWRSFSL